MPAGAPSDDVTLVGSGVTAPHHGRGLPPGMVIAGRYEVGRLIGFGGMGLIYGGRHLVLGTRVAIKVLRPELLESEPHFSRAEHEARCLAALDSEHVVRILDAGRLPTGLPYLVMERLRGSDLSTLLRSGVRMAVRTVVSHALQICQGLRAIHGIGMVHRDLKPANIFLASRPGQSSRVKILDFGIASWQGAQERRAAIGEEALLGSPAYASPEQFQGGAEVDARSDIWSLGMVLSEMLSGLAPQPGPHEKRSPGLTWLRSRADELGVRVELLEIVESCLEVDARHRCPSVDQLASVLGPLARQGQSKGTAAAHLTGARRAGQLTKARLFQSSFAAHTSPRFPS